MAVDKIRAEYDLDLKQFDKDIKQIQGQYAKTEKELQKSTKNQSAMFNRLGSTIVAAFSVQQIISFQKAIIKTTAEFEKMEAVLTNTLGSRGAAQAAMRDIVNFASRTPFQVQELTNSFVKLANFGLKPTMAQMRQLGDLAASTGKSYDQLAEAVIDATTGEFERLKEFGVRAKKEGDLVTFTFKGVETQVKFTSDAIREYVTSLGDVEGVSGSMAAISATVGGELSNLADNYTRLIKAIGDKESGLIKGMTELASETLSFMTIIAENENSFKRFIGQLIDPVGNAEKLMDDLIKLERERAKERENAGDATRMAQSEEFIRLAALAREYKMFGTVREAGAILIAKDYESANKFLDEQIKKQKDLNELLKKAREEGTDVDRIGGEIFTSETPKLKQLKNEKALEIEITKETSDRIVQITEEQNQRLLAEDKALSAARVAQNLEVAQSIATITTAFLGQSKASALLQLALSTGIAYAKATETAAKVGATTLGAGTAPTLATQLAIIAPAIAQAKQIIDAPIPTFYEGTENVTESIALHNLKTAKDPYMVRVHPNERIMTAMQNKKIGNMSNNEVVEAVEFYRSFQRFNPVLQGASFDYNRMDKIERKGALTVARKIDELRNDINSRKQDKFFSWQ